MRLRAGLVALALAGAASPLFAAEVTRQEVLLLQPDDELQFRVISVDAYGDYAKAVRAAVFDVLQQHTLPQPAAGFFVLVVRPGQQARVWLDFQPALPPALAQTLRARSLSLLPPLVREGPVLLTLKLSLDGAPWPVQAAPQPASWAQAAVLAGAPINLSNLVERVWDWPAP